MSGYVVAIAARPAIALFSGWPRVNANEPNLTMLLRPRTPRAKTHARLVEHCEVLSAHEEGALHAPLIDDPIQRLCIPAGLVTPRAARACPRDDALPVNMLRTRAPVDRWQSRRDEIEFDLTWGKIPAMTSLATVLKSEISRISRKEVRGDVLALKKALSTYRTEIAALKRRTQVLEQEVRRMSKGNPKAAPVEETEASAEVLRFSAKSLASQRRRLELSAHDCGLLVDASSQSIYNWEDGTTRPRPRHLAALAALRKLGKKEATARLEILKEAAQPA